MLRGAMADDALPATCPDTCAHFGAHRRDVRQPIDRPCELFHQLRHQPISAVPRHEDETCILARAWTAHVLPTPRSTFRTGLTLRTRNIERLPSTQLKASFLPTKAPRQLVRSSVPVTTTPWEPSTGCTRVVSPHVRRNVTCCNTQASHCRLCSSATTVQLAPSFPLISRLVFAWEAHRFSRALGSSLRRGMSPPSVNGGKLGSFRY